MEHNSKALTNLPALKISRFFGQTYWRPKKTLCLTTFTTSNILPPPPSHPFICPDMECPDSPNVKRRMRTCARKWVGAQQIQTNIASGAISAQAQKNHEPATSVLWSDINWVFYTTETQTQFEATNIKLHLACGSFQDKHTDMKVELGTNLVETNSPERSLAKRRLTGWARLPCTGKSRVQPTTSKTNE